MEYSGLVIVVPALGAGMAGRNICSLFTHHWLVEINLKQAGAEHFVSHIRKDGNLGSNLCTKAWLDSKGLRIDPVIS